MPLSGETTDALDGERNAFNGPEGATEIDCQWQKRYIAEFLRNAQRRLDWATRLYLIHPLRKVL